MSEKRQKINLTQTHFYIIRYTSATGMYIRALADGLSEVLCEYRKCVVQFEDYFLSHPMATLSELRNDLSEWFPVFLALRSRIYRVHIERMHGCHLLRLVMLLFALAKVKKT